MPTPSDITQLLADMISADHFTASRLFSTGLVVVIIYLLRWIGHRIVDHEAESSRTRYWWHKAITTVLTVGGAIVILRIWITGAQNLATYLGLLSAGIAIAFQRPLTNLFAWAFILLRHPLRVGDRVQIGQHAGDVIDIRMFQFTLLEIGNWVEADQSTGRLLHVPNGLIFSEVLANYGQGFEYIWHEIPVRITFESNWRKAKTIMTEIANHHARDVCEDAERKVRKAASHFLIVYSKLTPIVYSKVGAHGIVLTMRYLSQPRRRRSTEQVMWEDILDRFGAEDDIQFAYATQRIYARWMEHPVAPPDSVEAGIPPLKNGLDSR